MAVLLAWAFTTDFAPTTTHSGVSGSTVSNVAGSNTRQTSLGYSTDPVEQYIGPAGGTDVAGAVANNCYLEFTLTPNEGTTYSISSVDWKGARGGASTPRGYALRYSRDSYASNLQTADYTTQRTTWGNISYNASGNSNLQNQTTAVTFRLFLYHPSAVAVEQDDITINGAIGGDPTVDMWQAQARHVQRATPMAMPSGMTGPNRVS